MIKEKKVMSRLGRDTQGNMLALGAVGLLVTASLVGGGVDLSRAYKAQSRLQAACDAGVLAGRKAVNTNGFDQSAKDEAEAYFSNNFDQDEQGASGTVFVATSPDDGNSVNGTASTDVNSTIMRVFGFDTIELSVACGASMGVGNSDVTMVLDTTGSMGDPLESGGSSKIALLRTAMKEFYATLQAATAGGSARVRYGFVPYSSSINVGHLIYNQDPGYLVDSRTIQSREAEFETTTEDGTVGWEDPEISTGTGKSGQTLGEEGYYNSTRYRKKRDCKAALPSSSGWTDTGDESNGGSTETETVVNSQGQKVTTTTVTTKQERTDYSCVRKRVKDSKGRRVKRWLIVYRTYTRESYEYTYETSDPIIAPVETKKFDHWIYKPVTYDVSTFKTFSPTVTQTGNKGENQTSTWEGCIEERQTTPAATFSFNNAQGITPASAIDLDIDSAPNSFDDGTKWSPMWPDIVYYRTSFKYSWFGGGYYGITDKDESSTGKKAASYCPQKSQLLTEMSESEFETYADSLKAEGYTYHDLGILWGARISSPQGIFQANVNDKPANGGNVSRHLIFMTDGALVTRSDIQSTYGLEFHDHRVTANGQSQQSSRHNSRFLALCKAVKAKGIRLWVIAFDTGLTDDLEDCASSDSSFTADNADQLNEAFQEIAKEVGELRIVQ